jgi:cytochrome c-type biogenesis protein CcmH/NrfG
MMKRLNTAHLFVVVFAMLTMLSPVYAQSSQAEVVFAQGMEHFNRQEWREAETMFKQVLKIDKTHIESLYHLAYIAGEENRPNFQIKLLRQALKIDPDHEKALLDLALIYILGNSHKKGQQTFHRLMAIAPDNADYPYYLGFAYAKQAQKMAQNLFGIADAAEIAAVWYKADEMWLKALTVDPEHVDSIIILIHRYEATGRPADASAMWHRLRAINTDDPADLAKIQRIIREYERERRRGHGAL